MFKRLRHFRRVVPYFRNCRMMMVWGALGLFVANYVDVKVLVLLGRGIDVLGWRFGPFGRVQAALLFTLLAFTAIMAITAGAARFFMRWYIVGASRQIELDLRNDFFAHLQALSPSFYNQNSTGDMMTRATSDIEAVRLVIGPAVMYLSGTAMLLPMSLIQMAHISPKLTLYTWSPLLLLAPLFYFFSTRIHKRFSKAQETFSEISTRVQETLTGMRVIKAYAREEQEAVRFSDLSARYVTENIHLTVLQAFFIPLMGFIVGLSVTILIGAGGWMIVAGGPASGLSQGSLISFFVLLMSNIWPLAALGWVFSLLERGSASMERINAVFAAQPDIVNGVEAAGKLKGGIEVRGLTFAYPGATVDSLRDVSFTLPAGSVLGLTGPVGSGKSTIAHILGRRFNPPRGTVFLDGRDILDWPLEPLRTRIGIVDQEPFLFSDSIRANIAYGLPSETLPVVEDVSGIAQFTGEVEGFPNGFETLLGERGINLSGGQRQRAALARALAIDPAILILDDALAAVDTHTEEEILRGLREFMKGRTTILISHRISTVSMADTILYLEDGRVIEEGTHDELIALGGHYWTLARRQQLAEEIAATA